MRNVLQHSAADIVGQLLVDLGLGTRAGSWPVKVGSEPDKPDNVITTYVGPGVNNGRNQVDGVVSQLRGVQVRVRGSSHPTGFAKAETIAATLDQSVYDREVNVDGVRYLVRSLSRKGDLLSIGADAPGSERHLFTLNYLVDVKQKSDNG